VVWQVLRLTPSFVVVRQCTAAAIHWHDKISIANKSFHPWTRRSLPCTFQIAVSIVEGIDDCGLWYIHMCSVKVHYNYGVGTKRGNQVMLEGKKTETQNPKDLPTRNQ